MVLKFAESIIDQESALISLPVVDLIRICKNDRLNLEHEYQLVKLVSHYLKFREAPQYQKVKVKGPIRF